RHSTVERLKKTLATHLMEMFDGKVDAAFVEKRLRIARARIRIGLETKWYMGAFQNLYRFITDMVARHVPSKEEQIVFNHVVGKLINFEQQLVLEAYERERLDRQEKMHLEIKEDIKRKIAAVSEEATVVARKNEEAFRQLEKSSAQVHRSFERFMAKIQEVRIMTAAGKEQLRQLGETVGRIGLTSSEMEKNPQPVYFFLRCHPANDVYRAEHRKTNESSFFERGHRSGPGRYPERVSRHCQRGAEIVRRYAAKHRTDEPTGGAVKRANEKSEGVGGGGAL